MDITSVRDTTAAAGVPTVPPPGETSTAQTTPLDDLNKINSNTKLAAVFLGILAGDQYATEIPQPPAFGMKELDQAAHAFPQQQKQEEPPAQPGQPAAAPGGDWRVDVLKRIGAPITEQNLHVLGLWQKAEGGGAEGPSHTDFNWLNTTRTAADAPYVRVINSVGVKAYANYQAGINATVGALTNGRYGNVIDALRRGNDEWAVAEAIANSPWGTGNGVVRMLQGANGGIPHGGGRMQ